MYHPTYVKIFYGIYDSTFPSLWSLRSLGEDEYIRFQKLAKIATILAWVIASVAVLAATLALPWFMDGYYLMFPVKMAFAYLSGWMLYLYLIIFYSLLYQAGLTLVANLFCFTHLVLHLYNQVCLLNKKLTELPEIEDVVQAVRDHEYQDRVTREMISCIKLHQTLIE